MICEDHPLDGHYLFIEIPLIYCARQAWYNVRFFSLLEQTLNPEKCIDFKYFCTVQNENFDLPKAEPIYRHPVTILINIQIASENFSTFS